jgi:hypothetical protein
MRDLIRKNLSASVDPGVVDALITSYENLVAKFQKGDLDGCLGAAGKFVEHALRAVEYVRTGTAPLEIKSPQQTIKDIEKDHSLAETLRILMPRIAHAMIYDVRSKRGAIHVKEIDPRQIDAALTVQAASWVMAEFLRLYHDDNEQVIASAMVALMRGHIPLVEQFGDETVVTSKVPCTVELLLLLARTAREGLDRTELGQSSKAAPPTVTQALQRMNKARHVHRTRDGRFHITGPGERHLIDHLAQMGLAM